MIKEVTILSYQVLKVKVNELKTHPRNRFISIRDPDSVNELFPEETNQALPLQFHDFDPRGVEKSDFKIFSRDQAHKILDKIAGWHKLKQDIKIYVNCEAGISRSAGVAVFIVEYCNFDYNAFRRQHPWICPNPYIIKVLREAAGWCYAT